MFFLHIRHTPEPTHTDTLIPDTTLVRSPTFADFIAPIAQRWADFDFTRLRHGGADSSFSIEVGCNWKLAVENYCEAYHLPWIHPALNSYSRLEDHYNIAIEGRLAGQGSTAYRPSLSADGRQFPAHPGLPARWDGRSEEHTSELQSLMRISYAVFC